MHLKYVNPSDQEVIAAKPASAWLMACSIAAGFAVPLPSAAVENVHNWVQSCCSLTNKVLGVFNEVRPFDIEKANALSKAIILTRYDLCHQPIRLIATSIDHNCPFSCLGIGVRFSKEDLQTIKEQYKEINECLQCTMVSAANIVDDIAKE